jgi:Cys-tRNA(Pro)/Cys-tRNA(Cys) deacylase
MAKGTPATLAVAAAGVPFDLFEYSYDPNAAHVGLAAAEALGEPAARVFKTLMIETDGKPVCVLLPSDREVAMKRIAAVAGARSASMMPVPDAERVTGYRVGGISPFGQKRVAPIYVDGSALALPYMCVNGGRRGLQLRLLPTDLIAALRATPADITG